MCRSMGIVGFAAKPGKADWYSAPNRLAVLPSRFRAEKEDFFRAGRAPRGHMRSVQIDLAVRQRAGDGDSKKTTIALTYARDAGNSKPAIQFL